MSRCMQIRDEIEIQKRELAKAKLFGTAESVLKIKKKIMELEEVLKREEKEEEENLKEEENEQREHLESVRLMREWEDAREEERKRVKEEREREDDDYDLEM